MSLTALVGLALGTAAMTVVLSAFAGLEDLVADQFEDANPPLKISPANGPYLYQRNTNDPNPERYR